jgi:hypothetical protein
MQARRLTSTNRSFHVHSLKQKKKNGEPQGTRGALGCQEETTKGSAGLTMIPQPCAVSPTTRATKKKNVNPESRGKFRSAPESRPRPRSRARSRYEAPRDGDPVWAISHLRPEHGRVIELGEIHGSRRPRPRTTTTTTMALLPRSYRTIRASSESKLRRSTSGRRRHREPRRAG